jgi:HEAT repeat protein
MRLVLAIEVLLLAAGFAAVSWLETPAGLLFSLRRADPRARYRAAQGLAQLGPNAREAIPPLVAALADPTIGEYAGRALASIEGSGSLLVALHAPDPVVRSNAVRGLGSLPSAGKDVVVAVGEAARDPSPAVKASALALLERMAASASDAAPALASVLKDDADPSVRARVARLLGTMGATRILVDAVHDPAQNVRDVVVRCLAEHSDPETVPALVVALSDSDEHIADQAAIALRGLESKANAAVPPLTALAQEGKSPAVRDRARVALSGIAPALLTHEPRAIVDEREALRAQPPVRNQIAVPQRIQAGNIAVGKAIVRHGGNVNYGAAVDSWRNVNDGDIGTWWLVGTNNPGDPTDLVIDLGADVDIGEVHYVIMFDTRFGTGAVIGTYLSSDNLRWERVDSRTIPSSRTIVNRVVVRPRRARYVRVQWDGSVGDAWNGWGEFHEVMVYRADR